jgi:UDP-N-acetylmuramoyl-L-alanyl-D-glutamate--2,6-diaminopimelate ligase
MFEERVKQVTGLSCDSRHVKPGNMFFAIPGKNYNGEDFISAAIANGASDIVLEKPAPQLRQDVNYHFINNVRKTLSECAALFYGSQPQTIVGVTGTNGKTSVTEYYRQFAAYSNKQVATIGTLGVQSSQHNREWEVTTPDTILLHQVLSELVHDHITHVAIETTSHGLAQHRLDGVKFEVCAFTNLSHDHLDYHNTMEEYYHAKARLFRELLAPGKTAVLNADIPQFEDLKKICKARDIKILSYGKAGHDLKLMNWQDGLFSCEILGRSMKVQLDIIGEFQIYNILCAIGMVLGSGIEVEASSFNGLRPPNGRMEKVGSYHDADIYVDYANTPDALEHLLIEIRKVCKGKLHLVFGCGGGKYSGRRAIMGAVAEKLADYVVVTDDNPRHEDPSVIRSEITIHCPKARSIEGRELAIAEAISRLQPHDILIIAGKGHENYQIIGDKTMPYTDRETVLALL